ncbi:MULTISPECIES: penicillin-binding protein [unclassified Imperialibacter]|uniref:penicillin-binding protein n=1 Tax=unclassified Imperialibacter TaxID=2629706 RepID=UPI001257270D|nr:MULTISPECIES: penicillin-binding protein [unclassified Imperialibacter]CAD5284837.1 Cell division protein FtsI (Penicillin-binding protein 3) [Imperialibacter sp. 75]CAD5296633.1 Cell division protein FtsI (Penicillin-binding protein 3) [Imperialibacter sp. 89]VVT24279.1 Cell division protein FtsI (Penicillin-binding protein 3) [Imperialibacter sp. EC-SDR9]
MNIKSSILLRVRVAFLLVVLFAGAVVYRIFYLQRIQGDKWNKMAEQISLRYLPVKATRGNIYSDNGSLLATSLPFFKVAFDPSQPSDELLKKNLDSLTYLLSRTFKDNSAKEYRRRILEARKDKRQYLLLSRAEINYQQKKKIMEWPVFREGRNKGGIIFEKVEKRYHPFSTLGYRTIGSVDETEKGTVGLEYSFNNQLGGIDGKALFQKMAGSWRPVFDGTEVKAKDGLDIETTIDVNLQDVAESALLAALSDHNADYGSVVLMEVKTGEIKAMSNLSKNPEGNYWERYNYAVGSQGAVEPGSTFKLASMMALLEETDLKLTDTVQTGNGEYKFYNQVMKDHKPGGYGTITVKQMFESSSNIGIAKLVVEHFGKKPSEFIDFVKEMGVGQPLGFQMAGEGKPYIKSPSDSSWSGISLPWISHGYELKLTPLQTLTMFNAVANDGKMITPIIVRSVRKADKVVEEFEPRVINKRICSKETLANLRELLEGVVERGTASNINGTHYKIAGKTGTAKKYVNGKYVNQYYASFAGYFPADAPKYSCIVVIDNPKNYRIYGSDVAAPVFKEIADKIYSQDIDVHKEYRPAVAYQTEVFPVVRAGFLPELSMICNEFGVSNHEMADDEEWVKTRLVGKSIGWTANKVKEGLVPDVAGMTLRDALFVLENAGLKVRIEGDGRVESQSRMAGTRVSEGSEIKIKLG